MTFSSTPDVLKEFSQVYQITIARAGARFRAAALRFYVAELRQDGPWSLVQITRVADVPVTNLRADRLHSSSPSDAWTRRNLLRTAKF
jgi:hypothetical protein